MVRTTVVGNYPRIGDTFEEQKLRRAIARLDKGEITESDVREVEREVVRDVLQEQNDAGVDVVSDGQVSWYDSQSHIARKLAGIEIDGLARYFDTNTYYRQPVVQAAVAWKEPILVDEWRHAKDLSRAPVKAILTGPVTMASLALDKHYGKKRLLALDLAAALAEEVKALTSAGVTHLQVDEPILTRGPEELSLVAEALDVLAASKGSAELTFYAGFGDVARIYREVLKLPADVIGLDLVQGEATWSSIAKHGADKPLVFGVIDARNTLKEDSREVAARIRGLRQNIDLSRCYLSPSNGLEFLPRARAREKLEILVQAAKLLGEAA